MAASTSRMTAKVRKIRNTDPDFSTRNCGAARIATAARPQMTTRTRPTLSPSHATPRVAINSTTAATLSALRINVSDNPTSGSVAYAVMKVVTR